MYKKKIKKEQKRGLKSSIALFIDLSIQSGAVFVFYGENYLGKPYVHARNLQRGEKGGGDGAACTSQAPHWFSFSRPCSQWKEWIAKEKAM